MRIFAGIMYMFFAFAIMIMMIQCAQASRDYGINPTFIYGFFGVIVYSLQSIGFLSGYLSAPLVDRGFQQLAIIALLSLWFLAITLYFVRGHLRPDAAEILVQTSGIEFIALRPDAQYQGSPPPDAETGLPAFSSLPVPHKATQGARQTFSGFAAQGKDALVFRDRLSKQSALIARQFRLTTREAEVMELIARGNSVAHIAEALVVSENTIRTHNKRLYVKLGVHKRQDLLDLFEEFEK
jgi:DNA-binding CsgD family transcriptional regulator